jgi:streptomycin 6-kinase
LIIADHQVIPNSKKAFALPSLATRIAACEERWNLIVGTPFPFSYGFVAPARAAAGLDVVLKITNPNAETANEIAALRHYAGRAAVRLLDADDAKGHFLLERVMPGTRLSSIENDTEATLIAARLMRELFAPLPAAHQFPTAATWTEGLKRLRCHFGSGTGPFPQHLVETAESLFNELLASGEPPVLVHGDLHHENILAAGARGWLAVDPKGVAAEPAYEVGALLRNPTPRLWSNVAVQRRRIEILSDELGIDRMRLVKWGVAQSVLSAWWSYEDEDIEWEAELVCAEKLTELLR